MESLDERRLRLAREQEEREKKLKEIEQKKNSKVGRSPKDMLIHLLLHCRTTSVSVHRFTA